jgi:hypothetical protein
MTILSGGNVGVGITNPTAILDVGTTASCCATQTPTLGISELTSSNGRLPWIQFHAGGYQEAFLRLASSSRTLEIGDAQNIGTELAIMNNDATVRNVVISGKSISYFMGGNVGIGTTTPAYKLSILGPSVANGTGQLQLTTPGSAQGERSALTLYSTFQGTNDNAPRRTADIIAGFQGGAWGYEYLSLNVGNNANANDGAAITLEKMRILSNGNVGIGTTTPAYRLDLATGTFAFGNGNVRTETRDNAGLQGNAGAQSGFFETSSPTNYPAGASSWWHLIDCRHSNNGNNYALQIAGSFFDQKLYFRKTNNNASQAWTEVLSSANNPVSVSLAVDYTINTDAWTSIAPMTVTFTATKSSALIEFTSSGFGYTNSMAFVQFRIWNSTTGVSIGGTQTKIQSYDDTEGTITTWSCSFSKNITGLTPGTNYTLIVQAQRGGIWGTYDAVINAASTPDGHHMTLTVLP